MRDSMNPSQSLKARRLGLATLLVCCAVLIAVAPAFSQASSANGRIEGTVLDQSGAVVAGATVTAKNTGTGTSSDLTSDATGHFAFLTLRPGQYQVTVQKSGF